MHLQFLKTNCRRKKKEKKKEETNCRTVCWRKLNLIYGLNEIENSSHEKFISGIYQSKPIGKVVNNNSGSLLLTLYTNISSITLWKIDKKEEFMFRETQKMCVWKCTF